MFFSVFLTASALLINWIGGVEIYRWVLLRSADNIASAKVTAETFDPCSGRGCVGNGGPYKIKYEFNILNSELTYVYTGQMLFMERWVRVPKSVWEPAAKNGQINVLYAPQNPKINQPADIARLSYTNAFGLALLGVFMSVVCIFYWRGYKV